jgi:hypothetical protein
VALGFDEILKALQGRERSWSVAAAISVILTVIVLPDLGWRLGFICMAAAVWFSLRSSRRMQLAPVSLFLLMVLDVGSYAWQTPYFLSPREPDPLYLKYSRDFCPDYRIQGMYPWTVWAKEEKYQPVPVHGCGQYGEHGVDSWVEFPNLNKAYFLSAMNPRVASIYNGEFFKVDFTGPFKSSDFVTPENRHLVNLSSIRYFCMQEMALQEADRFPIVFDPEYYANPTRRKPLEPWRVVFNSEASADRDDLITGVPSLESKNFGTYSYSRGFDPADSFHSIVEWFEAEKKAGSEKATDIAWPVTLIRTGADTRMLFARAVSKNEQGKATVRHNIKMAGAGEILFALMPQQEIKASQISPSAINWVNPQIINPEKTIRYLEGDRVMVFENQEFFGRARVVHRGRQVSSNDEALEVMKDPGLYDPKTETLLMSSDAPLLSGPDPGPDEWAEILSCLHDEVKVWTRLNVPGYLVLADTYYPGWRAYGEDGRELRIYRSDMSLRAVALPEGGHTVTFRYLPQDFRIGLYVTLASIVSLAALGTAVGFRKRLTL